MAVGVGLALATQIGGPLVAGGALTGVGIAAAVGINAGLIFGLSAASAALQKRDLDGELSPVDINITSGRQPKIIVYGEAVVGGVVSYARSQQISGDENSEFWLQLVVAGHEINDITDVYYEGDRLESGVQITWGGSPATATIDSGPWSESDATHEAGTLWKYLGTSTQAVNATLDTAFSEITTAHRLRGYAYLLNQWQFFDESESIFSTGQPSPIRCKVQGSIVYDAQLEFDAVGTRGQDTTNAAYRVYSSNSIWCAVDYLMTWWPRPVAADRFDWDYLQTQADLCDVQVVVPPAASPSNFENRYSCNGALSLGDTPNTNLRKILATCLGRRSTSNGLIRLTVGDDVSSSVTLDESDIIGPIKVRTALPYEDRYNTVKGTYVSEDYGYTDTEFLSVTDATFVTRDVDTLVDTLSLPMVTGEYQAQRIAYKHLQQSDQQVTCEIPLRWSGLRLTPGDYLSLTYDKFSWSSKLFRCESIKISERGIPVTAVLREDSASAWADPDVGDYSTKNTAGVVTLPVPTIPPPTSMTATAVEGGIQIEWLNTGSHGIAWDFVRIYASPTSGWNDSPMPAAIGESTSGKFFHRLENAETRYYWVRSVKDGIESLREPNSDTSDRTAQAIQRSLPNLMPFGYSDFETASTSDFRHTNGTGTSAFDIDTAISYLGGSSLKVTTQNGSAGEDSVSFHTASAKFPIRTPPNRRFLVVAHFYPVDSDALSNINFRWRIESSSGSALISGTFTLSDGAAGAWHQLSVELNDGAASPLLNRTDYYLTIGFNNQAGTTSPITNAVFHIDTVMLFDATDWPDIAGDY